MAFTLAEAVVKLKTDDKELDGGLDKAQGTVGRWGGAMNVAVGNILSNVIVGGVQAIAGAVSEGVGAIVGFSQDAAQGQRDFQAQLGVSAQTASILGDVAEGVFKNNFGENLADVNAAIIAADQNLSKVLETTDDPDAFQGMVESALALRDAFAVDVSESTNAAATLMDKFGLSGQEAMDFLAYGLQNGLDTSGDFLDTIGEYSGHFKDMGFSAGDFFTILQQGQQGGMLGTDKVADSIKELNIRLSEGGSAAAEAFAKATGHSFEEVQGYIASGDEAWADYFPNIIAGLKGIQDPTEQYNAMVALFGTQAEDLGSSLLEMGIDGNIAMENMAGAAASLNAQYGSLGDVVEGMKRRTLVALEPVGAALLNLANGVMPLVEDGFLWFETNLVPAIQAGAEKVSAFATAFKEGLDGGLEPLEALRGAVEGVFGAEGLAKFDGYIEKGREVQAWWGDVEKGAGVAGTAINTFWEDAKAGADVAAEWLGVTREDLALLFGKASEGAPIAQAAIRAWWEDVKLGYDTYMKPVVDGVTGFFDWLSSVEFDFGFNWPELPDWATMNSPMRLHTGLMDLKSFTDSNPIGVQFQASGLESITSGMAALAAGGGTTTNNNYNVNAQVSTAAQTGGDIAADLVGSTRAAIRARGM